MSTPKLVRKRCSKCKRSSMVKPRERRCKREGAFWASSHFWCYGHLERPATRAPKKSVIADDAVRIAAQGEAYRAACRKEQAKHEALVTKWHRAMLKAERLMQKWEKKALAAAERSTKTDAEIESTRVKREAALLQARIVATAKRRLFKAAGIGKTVTDDLLDDDASELLVQMAATTAKAYRTASAARRAEA